LSHVVRGIVAVPPDDDAAQVGEASGVPRRPEDIGWDIWDQKALVDQQRKGWDRKVATRQTTAFNEKSFEVELRSSVRVAHMPPGLKKFRLRLATRRTGKVLH
jgi:hypothetical protein